jgi:periplasmic copper chaperone A
MISVALWIGENERYPMRAKLLALGAMLLLALPASAADVKLGAITLSAPWVRATPGGATTAAIYLTLTVTGAEGDQLLKASSPAADHAELHTSSETGGVMRMAMIPALEIKPGAPTTLASNGTHIMLVGLKAPLVAGQVLPLSLTFAHAGTVEVHVPVLSLTAKGPTDIEPLSDPHAGH